MLTPPSGTGGPSIDTADESLLWRDERELTVLRVSFWSCSVLRLSLSLSLCLLREKRPRPPDDCLDLSEDIVKGG